MENKVYNFNNKRIEKFNYNLFLPEDFLDGKGHILVTPLSELVDKAFGKKEEA